jgi:hypothetical protein
MIENASKRVLVDYREFRSDIQIINIYHLPKFYKKIQFPMDAKVAFLISVKLSGKKNERFEFFETVCVNNGYNVKLFIDADAARKWLIEP